MTDQLGEVRDLEAPEADALEQALPADDSVDGLAAHEPMAGVLSGDPEVPLPDAIEQHQSALVDEDDWR